MKNIKYFVSITVQAFNVASVVYGACWCQQCVCASRTINGRGEDEKGDPCGRGREPRWGIKKQAIEHIFWRKYCFKMIRQDRKAVLSTLE